MMKSNPLSERDAHAPSEILQAELWGHLVGAAPAFVAMLGQLRRITSNEAPVLIEGETGSGKELVARFIHYRGVRRSNPFVAINCGALPDHLLEAELFGHERGAFTDAKLARRGLVAEADGGTLFLDEADALSAKAQVALLRFLQDQRYRPLGGTRELSTDVRLITATNQPLSDAVQQGRFRSDLLYRLKILHISLPPLRERTGDAEHLARHFVNALCTKYGVPPKSFDDRTLSWIRSYGWPGNVRELENWVHREVLMAEGLTIRSMPSPIDNRRDDNGAFSIAKYQYAKAEAVRSFERDYLLAVIRHAMGNVTRAAQIAGKERRAFGKLLKKHGIDPHSLN